MAHPSVPPLNAEHLHDRLPGSTREIIDAGRLDREDAADTSALLNTGGAGRGYASPPG
jgi:hypothetical protein